MNCELAILAAPDHRPELSLEVFDSIPAWAIAHAADDNSAAPLIRYGEVVVVESNGQAGWYPADDGSLFLIEYVSPPPLSTLKYERRTRAIVETRRSNRDPDKWYAAPRVAPRTLEAGQKQIRQTGILWGVDGPYTEEQLIDRLIGRVVGIYRPGRSLN